MKKPQLFLLHFAGGNCYSYHFMLPLLEDFEVIPIELPGRGRRSGEPLLKDFDQAATDVLRQIERLLSSDRFLIYGHSLGAYLALRISGMLQERGCPPSYLIVSGNAGPGCSDPTEDIHHLEKPEFFRELKRLGGLPEELLENSELMDYFEPILRADFEMAENCRLNSEQVVAIPIYAMMGSEEAKADEIVNWANYTQKGFQYEILEGDHFFIHKHPGRMAHILKECWNELL